MALIPCGPNDAALDLVNSALTDPTLIFKHSPLCFTSLVAADEVEAFEADHPDVPVRIVNVFATRGLARWLATLLQVKHESPQAILVARGRARWTASHRGVTRTALAEALAGVRAEMAAELRLVRLGQVPSRHPSGPQEA